MADNDVDMDSVLNQYTDVVQSLTETPYDYSLHLEHLNLASQLGLEDEVKQARELFSQYFPLDQELWLKWIEDVKRQVAQAGPEDVDAHIALLGLYKRASRDFLSIPILLSFSEHLISSHYNALGLNPPPSKHTGDDDEDADEEDDVEDAAHTTVEARSTPQGPNEFLSMVYDIAIVREARDEIITRAGQHLAEAKKVWALWRDFEVDLFNLGQHDLSLLPTLESFYLSFLSTPHLGIEDTIAEYSSLVSKYDDKHYGTKLPEAAKVYGKARAETGEREVEEAKLKKAHYTLEAYTAYLQWEQEPKHPNLPLISGLFERALQAYPKQIDLWEMFLDVVSKTPAVALATVERAVRCNPESAPLWATYLRLAEKTKQGSAGVEALFERIMETRLFDQDVEGLVVLYEARAAFHRRDSEDLNKDEEDLAPEMIDTAVEVLQQGIKRVKDAVKKGKRDPQLRLEKHLIRLLERYGRADEVAQIWEKLTKDVPYSYAVWYGWADFETRAGDVKKAHEVYQTGSQQRGMDYPEYLLDAWVNFEKQCGTLSDLEYTMRKVKRQLKGLEMKRLREAQEAAEKAGYSYPTAAATTAPTDTTAVTDASSSSMTTTDPTQSKKRERSPVSGVQAAGGSAKKFRSDEGPPVGEPKRDRENSTVFVVASSEVEMEEEDLKKLFRDCGDIRECKLKKIDSKQYAMIEFFDKSSVPAAQTKDKKKINGVEVDVHIAWQSCLWVTNYPEGYTKETVEALFAPYGTIFDTRWPSKRFKDTRRFCYVQFTSPESAQASLELHGKVLEDGLKLSVLVSDPAARVKRTDAGANKKELYVAGLSKFVKEFDLRKLFSPMGNITGIRLGLDDKGDCKGFAFVEFEDEESAQKSLSLNSTELKKRTISITIAEARKAGLVKEAPRQARSELDQKRVRVRGIPAGTDEAIVQQAFEKVANVRIVVMDVGATEAVVEFTDAAEAGKVLLAHDSITVDGTSVEVVAESAQARAAEGKKSAPAAPVSATGLMMPRQSAGRRRGGLGHRGGARGGIGAGAGRAAAATAPATSSSAAPAVPAVTGGKSQDDFRKFLGGN